MKANKLLLLSASSLFMLASCGLVSVKGHTPASSVPSVDTSEVKSDDASKDESKPAEADSSEPVEESGEPATPSTPAEETSEQKPAGNVVDLDIGETYQIPASATGGKEGKVRYACSDTSVATVDENGLVKAWGPSEDGVVITVTVNHEETYRATVYVNDPKASERSTLTLQTYPTELVLNDEEAFNADDYCSATAGYFYLTTKSETVRIEGHKIIGIACGDFVVTIRSGNARRAFSGTVVSAEKAELNALIRGLDNAFTVSSSFGTFFNTEEYYAELYDSDSSTGDYIFRGGVVNHEYVTENEKGEEVVTDMWLPFEYTVNANSGTESFQIRSGYARSLEDKGYLGWTVDPMNFKEELDADGNSTGNFFLDDEGADEYGEGGLVSTLLASFGGLDYYWSNIFAYDFGADAIRFRLASEQDGYGTTTEYFEIMPAKSTQKGYTILPTFTSGSSEYSSEIDIFPGDPGFTTIDEYIASPFVVDQIDTTPITGFIDDILGASAVREEGMSDDEYAALVKQNHKPYTLSAFGEWYDLDTGATKSCPSGWRFSDGTAAFGSFQATTYVNNDIFFSTVNEISEPGYSLFRDLDYSKAGDSALYIQNGNELVGGEFVGYTEQGSVGAEMKPVTSSSGEVFTDFWDLIMVPWQLGSNAGYVEYASWYDSAPVLDAKGRPVRGKTQYFFDLNGFDVVADVNSGSSYAAYNYAGVFYHASTLIPGYLGDFNGLMWGLQEGIHDITEFSFIVDTRNGTLTWMMDIHYALGSGMESAAYRYGWTISNVGVDAVPENVKAFRNTYFHITDPVVAPEDPELESEE